MSVIELNDVSVTFHEGGRTVEAVKHVNISVEKGEIFGIVGFSGAGKSTLVRTINLLERPTGGHVVIAAATSPHSKAVSCATCARKSALFSKDST